MQLKIANLIQITVHFNVTTNNYFPHSSEVFKVSKYSTYITRLEKTTEQHKSHLHVMHMIKLKISMIISM